MNEKILEVKNLSVSFNTYAGEVKALRDISFHVNRGVKRFKGRVRKNGI